MTDPTIAAARETFDDAVAQLREAVAGAPAEALNRRPAGTDTNSIAVLVTHVMASARWWISVALGASLPKRDRAAEFRTNAASAEELLAFLDATAKDCRALLATEKPFDPAAERIAPDTMNRGERESVTTYLRPGTARPPCVSGRGVSG